MPRQYERIRDSLAAKGEDMKTAKRIAAATYNKQHPGAPMSPAHPNPENPRERPKGLQSMIHGRKKGGA
jgi:hypothetical protein